MYEKISIALKNGSEAVWEKDQWDDYALICNGKALVIKKKDAWVGVYNFDEVLSVIVE